VEVEDKDDDQVDYKELYYQKDKENQEFLQRIDTIIAEQEEELSALTQSNKTQASEILDLQDILNECRKETEDKNTRIIEMSDEKEEELAKIKETQGKEMEDLKVKMKRLKKQWEQDVMDQVKFLEGNWKLEIENTNSK
jgi:predicted RNase H-like nuclease (RuvC/YqgF family)